MEFFAIKFREILKNEQINQSAFADKLGVSRQCITDYKSGKSVPSVQTLCKMSDLLHVSVDYLLGREDDLGNISISGSPASELTSEERELIETFRAIPDNTKGVALTMLHSLAPAKKEKSTLKKRA